MTALPQRNKGRTARPRVDREIWHVADFKGFKVTARQWSCRFTVNWDWVEVKESNEGFLAFRDALDRLEKSTHYRQDRKDGSLIGDLCSDWEPAHIFVALNLIELEKYAAGGWAHFHEPSYCCWMAMEAGYRYGKEVR